jgi:UDP-N-acetylglucosamine 3-dehydrogenase
MIRIGVIGVGAMGRNHVRVYSELSGIQLVGIADADYARAKDVAERYHTRAFADYRHLLKKDLDAVSIAVPTSLHHRVAVDVSRARASMLVEKPIADTVEAAKEMIMSAEAAGVKLMVGHSERFNPVVAALKNTLDNAQPSLIEITRIGPFPPRIKDVGVMIDLATHDIDLVRYLIGSGFVKVHSLISKNLGEHEDVAVLLFEMANGTLARITEDWLTPFKVREVSVATSEKFVKAFLIEQKLFEYSKYKENDSYVVKEVNVPFGEPLKLELTAFTSCVINNEPPPVSGADGLRALEVATNCLVKESVSCVRT